MLGFPNRLHPHLQVRVEPRTEMDRIYSYQDCSPFGDYKDDPSQPFHDQEPAAFDEDRFRVLVYFAL